jgi:hypothetical protein
MFLIKVTEDKFNADSKLNEALKNKTLLEPEMINGLREESKQSKTLVKKARKNEIIIAKIARKSATISSLPADKRSRALAKLMAKRTAWLAQSTNTSDYNVSVLKNKNSDQIKPNSKENSKKETSYLKKPSAKTHRNASDMLSAEEKISKDQPYQKQSNTFIYRSKPSTCEVSVNQVDDVTRQRRIILKKSTLFTHTDDELRPYFREEELVSCEGNLSIVSGFTYFTIEFRIASPNAQRNFGPLEEGSLLRIITINGSTTNMYNLKYDRGRIDPYSGDTIYTGYYSVNKEARKLLSKNEVDKIRIVWGAGYEDYDVYYLDFFVDQFHCLSKYQ